MEQLTAFLDANVLYPGGLRNLLMRLTLHGLFQAKWSDNVHEEWIRSVLVDRPDLTREKLERTRQLMDAHAQDSLVTGYAWLIEHLVLPDPDDRHVLAAAIIGRADLIVTFNIKDFPPAILRPYGMETQHPDAFITHLMDMDMGGVCAAAREHRLSLKKPPKTVEAYLDALERQGLPVTVSHLRGYAPLI